MQGQDEAGVVVEMEVIVEAEEDDDDNNDYSEVSDNDFEENWDWTKSLDPQRFTQTSRSTLETNQADSTNSDFGDEDGYSDELDTPDGSDDEGDLKVRFPCFKEPENDEDVKFEVGLQFSNKKQIIEAIKTFAIISKKNLKVKKMITRESLQSIKKKGLSLLLTG